VGYPPNHKWELFARKVVDLELAGDKKATAKPYELAGYLPNPDMKLLCAGDRRYRSGRRGGPRFTLAHARAEPLASACALGEGERAHGRCIHQLP
jgi:hypothetical protein